MGITLLGHDHVTRLTASMNVSPYTRTTLHEATRCRFNQTGDTTMTDIQTNRFEALSDAEIDNVAGGFSFANFMLGHGDPRLGQFRAAAITVGAIAAPGIIGGVAHTVGSVVSHLKFW
jgi:hypothetical protein